MLFPGDAETEERTWLMENHSDLLDTTVLKASHHGSGNGADGNVDGESWIEHVDPMAVVLTAGEASRFGHPTHGGHGHLRRSRGHEPCLLYEPYGNTPGVWETGRHVQRVETDELQWELSVLGAFFLGGGKQPRLRGHQRRHTSVTYFTIRPWVGKLAVEEDHRSTKLTRCRGTRRVETTHANSQQKRGRLGTRTYDWTYSRIENGVTSTLSDCVTRFCPASSTG